MAPEAAKKLQAKIEKLGIEFRKMPMYQFFTEIGPLEAYAVIQFQMGMMNSEFKIVGVFLFEDEAEAAKDFMKRHNKVASIDFAVKPTKITRMKGF